MLELFSSVRQWLDRCDSSPQGCSMILNRNLKNYVFEVNLTLDVTYVRRKAINEGGRYYHESETSQVHFHQLNLFPQLLSVHFTCYPNVPLGPFQVRCQEERRSSNNEKEILLVTHVTTGWYQKSPIKII